jgi:hypothetical protein
MPVVRRIRKRNLTITVESHAEVLFMPGGQVFNWQNRFSQRIKARTIARAPGNKRPRWAHYGKPLKSTIQSAYPRFWSNGKDKMRVYGAVGSGAPYAAFVDQGTGVFNGGAPWEAKILPPWQWEGASLYEATWRPGGPSGRRVAPVMIKGQPGQHYFDKGLADAFRSMRMRSFQVPGEGGPKISEALSAIPSVIEGKFHGPTATPGFMNSLREWREWRDRAWNDGEGLGRGGGVGSRAHARARDAQQSKPRSNRPRSSSPQPKRPPKPKPPRGYASLADKKTAAIAAFHAQNPNVRIAAQTPAGINVISPVNRRLYTIHWDQLFRLLG